MQQSQHYNKHLQPRAKELRSSMTKAEAALWKYVLKSKQTGHIFRRQRPIGDYIVDFCCLPKKLIIEIDGSTHNNRDIWKHDLKRQKVLESCGYKVIRFTNEEVLENIEGVRFTIKNNLKNGT